jgi:hypothetical protein
MLERRDEGVLNEFLGEIPVPERADQGGGEPSVLLAKDALERFRSYSGCSTSGRISMVLRTGQVFAMAIASSRSFTSTSA